MPHLRRYTFSNATPNPEIRYQSGLFPIRFSERSFNTVSRFRIFSESDGELLFLSAQYQDSHISGGCSIRAAVRIRGERKSLQIHHLSPYLQQPRPDLRGGVFGFEIHILPQHCHCTDIALRASQYWNLQRAVVQFSSSWNTRKLEDDFRTARRP